MGPRERPVRPYSSGVIDETFSPADLVAFVRRSPRGVVATVDSGRGPTAALVDFAVTDAGEVVFDSRSDARKIANLDADPRVALVIGCGDESLQLEGVAEVATGSDRLRYGREYEVQHPGARALVDGFAVVVVTPRWWRLYDARQQPPRIVEGVPSA